MEHLLDDVTAAAAEASSWSLLVEVLSLLVGATTAALPDAIHDALRIVGQQLGLDRLGVIDIERSTGNMILVDDWRCYWPEVEPTSPKTLPLAAQRNMVARMESLERVWIEDTSKLAGEWADDRTFLMSRGITAAANLPMTMGGKFTGFLFVDCYRSTRRWNDVAPFLAAFTDLLSSAFERQRNDQVLRKTERHHRLLAENAADVISLIETDGTISYLSPSSRDLFGVEHEAVIGTSFFDLVDPEDRASVEASFLRLPRTNGTSSLEFRVHRPGRPVRWCESVVKMVNDGSTLSTEQVLCVTRDATERHRVQKALAFQAFHDPLTGLPNRASLMSRLIAALERPRSDGSSVALMYIDVDQFKLINDSMSHSTGDQLLCAIGRRISSAVRPSDLVARAGGDEFIVLCEVQSLDEMVALGERLQVAMADPFVLDAREIRARVSGGIALGGPGVGAASLLQHADMAASQAKDLGRDRFEVFDERLEAVVRRRSDTEQALHLAVGTDQIVVHYQPLVDLRTHAIAGFEALVRWLRPGHGLLAPSEFLDVAEESGLIRGIGRQVFQLAAQQLRIMREIDPALVMHINVAPQQLDDASFLDHLREDLDAVRLEPGALCIEITESALMRNLEASIVTLNAVRAMGVEIAMDDFGTGYSSLAYLQQLPVTTLKIDQSFVAGMSASDRGAAIVKGVVNLAHILGMSVVAEGVETAQQAERLRAKGADLAQGFLFARPLSSADALRLLG